jgi:hypothetical protein
MGGSLSVASTAVFEKKSFALWLGWFAVSVKQWLHLYPWLVLQCLKKKTFFDCG